MHHHEADVRICRFATVKGHPLPQFPCSIDMPDDFFCVRLGNKGECPTNDDEDDEDMDDIGTVNSLVGHSHLTESLLSFSLSSLMRRRPSPPEPMFVVTSSLEILGPAKLVTDMSAESPKTAASAAN